MIGQVLYLEAEAHGVRGTGIGCFFDDAVHEILGIKYNHYQSLYHFTIGRQVEENAYDSVTMRAYVGKRRKAALLAKATRNAFRRYQHDHAPPLKETVYLLDAVART